MFRPSLISYNLPGRPSNKLADVTPISRIPCPRRHFEHRERYPDVTHGLSSFAVVFTRVVICIYVTSLARIEPCAKRDRLWREWCRKKFHHQPYRRLAGRKDLSRCERMHHPHSTIRCGHQWEEVQVVGYGRSRRRFVWTVPSCHHRKELENVSSKSPQKERALSLALLRSRLPSHTSAGPSLPFSTLIDPGKPCPNGHHRNRTGELAWRYGELVAQERR